PRRERRTPRLRPTRVPLGAVVRGARPPIGALRAAPRPLRSQAAARRRSAGVRSGRMPTMSAEPSSPAGVLHMSEKDYLEHYADLRPSYEFVNGEVTQKPMTQKTHMKLARRLNMLLLRYE